MGLSIEDGGFTCEPVVCNVQQPGEGYQWTSSDEDLCSGGTLNNTQSCTAQCANNYIPRNESFPRSTPLDCNAVSYGNTLEVVATDEGFKCVLPERTTVVMIADIGYSLDTRIGELATALGCWVPTLATIAITDKAFRIQFPGSIITHSNVNITGIPECGCYSESDSSLKICDDEISHRRLKSESRFVTFKETIVVTNVNDIYYKDGQEVADSTGSSMTESERPGSIELKYNILTQVMKLTEVLASDDDITQLLKDEFIADLSPAIKESLEQKIDSVKMSGDIKNSFAAFANTLQPSVYSSLLIQIRADETQVGISYFLFFFIGNSSCFHFILK